MKKLLIIFLSIFLLPVFSFADFKKIKKKATITQPEIIFPLPKNLDKCKTKLYVNPEFNHVTPVLKVEAPSDGPVLCAALALAHSRITFFTFLHASIFPPLQGKLKSSNLLRA